MNILETANSLVGGERGEDYGHPLDDFTRTGKMWAAILGLSEVTPEQVGLCMSALKISRECNAHKMDNLVDGAGYLRTVEMVKKEKYRRHVVTTGRRRGDWKYPATEPAITGAITGATTGPAAPRGPVVLPG